ncbi:hypothetical protein OIU76_025810 [Salix suchowensis]|nr:hypothetical protein OIU76_025810 [Salix suchowensis]
MRQWQYLVLLIRFFSYVASCFPPTGLPYQVEKKWLAMVTPLSLSLSIYLANGCLLISALSRIPLFMELIFHASTFLPALKQRIV